MYYLLFYFKDNDVQMYLSKNNVFYDLINNECCVYSITRDKINYWTEEFENVQLFIIDLKSSNLVLP